MASLFGCFKPRQPARLSESGLTSLVAKRHSAIAAIISGVSASSCTSPEARVSPNEDHTQQPDFSNLRGPSPVCDGLGILIYPSLLLTTHSTIPSPSSAHDAEINLRYSDTSLNILRRRFLPELFFATDAKLNVTVIACEFVNPEMHPLGIDTSKVDEKAFEVGSKVYVLGHDRNKGSPIRLSVGCGYVITANNGNFTIRSREEAWLRGSAGFDHKGNFALMITDSVMGNERTLRNACVSINCIKSWLEPQWQATKSNTTPRPRASLVYNRRATYAGPETGPAIDAYVKEFDEMRANAGNGKAMTNSSSVVVLGDHEKSTNSRPEKSGAEVGEVTRFYDMRRDEAEAEGSSTGGVLTRQMKDYEEKQVKSEGLRKANSMKEEMQGRGKAASSSGVKEVEVMAKEPTSAMRGNTNAGKKGKVSMTPAPAAKEDQKKRGAGGAKAGSLAGKVQTFDMNRKGKPTSLQQAFQRDRKSLQLRLHDIPIKDKL